MVREKLALKGLAHEICTHFQRGTVLNRQVLLFNLIGKEEITDVDSAGSLAGTALTILQ